MEYLRWRNEVFGASPGADPVTMEASPEFYSVSATEALDHIDRALVDPDIHTMFSKDQIGVGLNLIYSNACSDLPFSYLQGGNDARRVQGISNLRYLYGNFFDRYCTTQDGVGGYQAEGRIGFVCFMFWDIFVLYPGNASPGMTTAALDVMSHALESKNDNSIVSAIHGLGHWAEDDSQAIDILAKWLRTPTTQDSEIQDYARQAMTGCIL